MGSSRTDSNLIVISKGKKAYYSCHKGVGNILFELNLGIFTGKKPTAKSAFNALSQYSWKDWIEKLDKPLSFDEASYGYLIINFDTNTIVSRSRYSYPNSFNTQWILQSLRSIFERKSKENVITDKSMVYLFENGYIKMRNNKGELFDFNMSLKEFYEKTKEYKYREHSIVENIPELKQLNSIFIQLPNDWNLINQEEDIDNYNEELALLLNE